MKKTSFAFTIVVKIPKGINADKLKYDLALLSEIISKTKVSENARKKLGLLCFEATVTCQEQKKIKHLDLRWVLQKIKTFFNLKDGPVKKRLYKRPELEFYLPKTFVLVFVRDKTQFLTAKH